MTRHAADAISVRTLSWLPWLALFADVEPLSLLPSPVVLINQLIHSLFAIHQAIVSTNIPLRTKASTKSSIKSLTITLFQSIIMQFKLTSLALIASLLGSALAAPAPVPQSSSAYQCPAAQSIPARKAHLQGLGATDQGMYPASHSNTNQRSFVPCTRHYR